MLATLEPPPAKLGVTHWSSRLLGDQLGISNVWVARTWRKWGLQPWRRQTFKFSTDPSRCRRLRHDRGGCPLYAGDGGTHTADTTSPAAACRFPAASP